MGPQARKAAPSRSISKRQVLYYRYYETFDKYKEACRAFFDRLEVYVPQLRTLLTENLEIVRN